MKKGTTVFLSELLRKQYPGLCDELAVITNEGCTLSFLPYTRDIWLRDFMPVQLGNHQFVQFSLSKNYYYKKDRGKKTEPAPVCEYLDIHPKIAEYKGKPVFLDGGNIVLNPSRTKAIITEKVFNDNETDPVLLKGIIQELLQVEQVIYIPA